MNNKKVVQNDNWLFDGDESITVCGKELSNKILLLPRPAEVLKLPLYYNVGRKLAFYKQQFVHNYQFINKGDVIFTFNMVCPITNDTKIVNIKTPVSGFILAGRMEWLSEPDHFANDAGYFAIIPLKNETPNIKDNLYAELYELALQTVPETMSKHSDVFEGFFEEHKLDKLDIQGIRDGLKKGIERIPKKHIWLSPENNYHDTISLHDVKGYYIPNLKEEAFIEEDKPVNANQNNTKKQGKTDMPRNPNPGGHVTIESTKKWIKAHQVLAWISIIVGILIEVISTGESGGLGVLMFLGGVAWLGFLKIAKWWHHG